MANDDSLAQILVNPNTCFEKLYIFGYQVLGSPILALLAAGETIAAMLKGYPGIKCTDGLAWLMSRSEMGLEGNFTQTG
jgi:uncharacterized protein (DUF433 family)